MRYSQLARTAVQAVFGNGLRSALTMLGLVIGISSVIILVGIGDGTNRQVSEKMKALGGDALSAYLFDGDMGYNDLSGMNDLGAVDGVAPSKSLMKKLSVGTTVANKAFVEATDEHYLHVRNLKLQEGRNLSAVDRENRSKVIVLGSDVAKTLLGSADGAVGRTVKLDGDEFTVVGVLQNQGQSMGLNTGNVALVPFSTAVSMGESGTITSFYAKARGEDAIEAAKGEIGSYLTGTVHIPPGRFDIISQDEMLRAGNEIDGTMTLLLAGIAGISASRKLWARAASTSSCSFCSKPSCSALSEAFWASRRASRWDCSWAPWGWRSWCRGAWWRLPLQQLRPSAWCSASSPPTGRPARTPSRLCAPNKLRRPIAYKSPRLARTVSFPMHATTSYSTGEEGVEKEILSQFLLPSITLCYHIRRCLKQYIGLWLSLVERCVRDAEAAGSNPVNPTRNCRSAVRG